MAAFDIVTPSAALAHALSEQLAPLGDVTVFSSAEAAQSAWGGRAADFVIWDVAASGDGLADFWRERTDHPVFFWLGPLPDDAAGGMITEQFVKPLRLGVLLGRIPFYRQLQKRAALGTARLGPLTFSLADRTLAGEGGSAKLTDKEAALLDYLLRADAPATKDDLLAAVWGYESGLDTHTLETHIYRLRRKVADLLGQDESQKADENPVFCVEDGCYFLNPSWQGNKDD